MTWGTLLYLGYLAANLVMAGTAVILCRRVGTTAGVVALLLIALALVFDTAVVSSGNALGAGASLQALNWVRFLVGDLAVPLFVLPVVDLGRRLRTTWVERIPAWPLVVLLVGLGLVFEMASLSLHADPRQGVLRYSADHPALPYAAIVVTFLALGLGWSLGRHRGSWVLFTASLITVVVSAVPISAVGVAPESGAEILFTAGFLATYAAFRGRPARASG